jgi:hypothetical protein
MSILALTSDTLIGTPATGNIEYNGQFFGTDSNASRAQLQRIVRTTAVASTSGATIDFTGIPAWAEKITVMFSSLSTNGVTAPQIQIGSTTFTTSGYLGAAMSGAEVTNNASGFLLNSSTFIATGVLSGGLTLCNLSGNVWVAFGASGRSDIARGFSLGGVLTTLAGTLDRVRITTVGGTDTFDAGSVNIIYEG